MDIYLIRHGDKEKFTGENLHKEWDLPDEDLNDLGREQARRVGLRLANLGIQAIYSSGLKRAVQTAEIINSFLKGPIHIQDGLREIHMGRLHYETWEQIRATDPLIYEAWHRHQEDLPYPGGECGGDVYRRAFPVIQEIITGDIKAVAVVAHAGVIRALLCGFLGIGFERRLSIGSPLENCSISHVKYDKVSGTFVVHSINDAFYINNTAHPS